MTRKQVTAVKKAIKATGAACTVQRVGGGKYQSINLWGAQAAAIATSLEGHGLTRTLMSGTGADQFDAISMDLA